MLKEFFPSKDKKILQYEAMSFIADKNNFKQKWSSDEDNILVKFLEQENIDKRNMSEEQLNWN